MMSARQRNGVAVLGLSEGKPLIESLSLRTGNGPLPVVAKDLPPFTPSPPAVAISILRIDLPIGGYERSLGR